jgi:hypothetical protein
LVLRWPAGSYVRVGRKRGLRRSYTERKRQQGGGRVLGAPVTVEWVTTAEAVEAPVIGQLLVASSCTNGEKVVKGDRKEGVRQPVAWGRAAALPAEERSVTGQRGGVSRSDSEAMTLGHARSGGAQIARRRHGFGQRRRRSRLWTGAVGWPLRREHATPWRPLRHKHTKIRGGRRCNCEQVL